MSDKATLDKMKQDLQILNQSNDPDKDQKARKLRRDIRALAKRIGEPPTARIEGVPSSRSKSKAPKKSGSAIDLSQVTLINRGGEEVDSLDKTGMSKADRRKARREARKAAEGNHGKNRRHYSAYAPDDPSLFPAVQCVPSIKECLISHHLETVADGQKRSGYAFSVERWPMTLINEKPAVKPDKDTLSRQDDLVKSLIEKFTARLNQDPQWFFLLRQGPGVIVALGPVPEGLAPKKSKARHEEEDESD